MSNSSLGLAFGHGNPTNMMQSQRNFANSTGGMMGSQNMLGSQNISMINTITNNNKFYMTPIEEIKFANDQRYFDPQYHKNRGLGQYVGERKNNLRHGYGEMWYENGDYYAGSWEYNLPHGEGLLFFSIQPQQMKFSNPPKITYAGTFDKGFFHGIGKLFISQSATEGQFIYIGNWKYGKKQGYGKQFYNNSDRYYYVGSWANDMKNGDGRFIFDNNQYDGKWMNDKMHGEGSLVLKEGSQKTVTIGIWNQDELNSGQIIYYDIKADHSGVKRQQQFETGLYKGEIKDYLRDGEGCYQVLNTAYYGQFQSDRPVGPAIIKDSIQNNQYELETDFSDNKIKEANASIYYWNKDRYEGKVDIQDWTIKRTKGKYYYSNGEALEGEFEDNPYGELRGRYRQIN